MDKVAKKRLKACGWRLTGAKISDRNREFVRSFIRYRSLAVKSHNTWGKDFELLLNLARWSEKDFDRCNRKDIEDLAAVIGDKTRSDATYHGYRVTLKLFFKWLRGSDGYPEEVRWLKTGWNTAPTVTPQDLLTEDEIKRLVEACREVRDKALISILPDSGARIGEALALRVGDVTFDGTGAWVCIPKGKTGQRKVRVVTFAAYLREWVKAHPDKDNPKAPLFVAFGNAGGRRPLTYAAVRAILKRAAKQAGITKRVYPHLFRHTRATGLAGPLNEEQLKKHFGWSRGSDMPGHYVHFSDESVGAAIDRAHGLPGAPSPEPGLKPWRCPRCGEWNPPTTDLCLRCSGSAGASVPPSKPGPPGPDGSGGPPASPQPALEAMPAANTAFREPPRPLRGGVLRAMALLLSRPENRQAIAEMLVEKQRTA